MKKIFTIVVTLIVVVWLSIPVILRILYPTSFKSHGWSVWLSVPDVVRNMYWYRMNPLSATFAAIEDKTVWSAEYSEKAFKSIKVGFTSEDVLKAIGPPIYIDNHNENALWHYTVGSNGQPLSGSENSTHVRAILFDKNMKVDRKYYSFYFD